MNPATINRLVAESPYGILHADGRAEGSHRDWWSGGVWTVPGDVIVEMTVNDLAEIKAMREVVKAATELMGQLDREPDTELVHADDAVANNLRDALAALKAEGQGKSEG